jgi:O-antigen/teichoic acid export membrane protein
MRSAIFSQLRLARPDSVFSPLSLRQNFLWTLLGNAGYAGSRFLILVILAKLGSPEMVGEYALGVAISMPVLAFTDLQLRTVMVTDVNRDYDFGEYLGLNIFTTLLGILVIIGILIGSGYSRERNLVILLVTLDRAVWSISNIVYGLFQQNERMDFISSSMLLKSGLSLAVIALLAYLTGSLAWICLGLALSSVAAFWTYDFPKGLLFTRGNPYSNPGAPALTLRPSWPALKLLKLAWLALPLGGVFALLALNYNIPRFFIEKYQGARELGIFAAIYAPAAAGRFILTALGSAASRRLARHFTLVDRKAFITLLVKLAGIAAVIGGAGIIIAALAGKEILELLYRPEYAAHSETFLWLMVASGVYYLAVFMGYGMTAARQFWAQIPLFVITGLVSALACYYLVPSHGLAGAAYAEILAQVATLLGSVTVIILAMKYVVSKRHVVSHED